MKYFKIIVIFFSFLISTKAFSQLNYSFYYTCIDSAEFYRSQGKIDSTNLYYQKAFSASVGFDTDYSSAIYPYYLEHKILDTLLIAQTFSIGERKKEIFALCKRRNIPFSKKQLRKIYRDHKLKPILKPKIFKWMLFRDQIARRYFPKKVDYVDSKNAKILIRFMHDRSDYFDRNNLSIKNYGQLEILLIHAGWNNLSSEFNTIQTMIKEGKLNRMVGAAIVERAAISKGYLFKIDSEGHILGLDNQKQQLCNFYYPNIYFNYGLKYDRKNKQVLLPPFHPNLSEKEVDSLRQFLFLSPLNMLQKQQQYRFLTSEEFCNFKNE
ncbi:hypothetical protein [Fluviicola taffensis]|uniref:YARHG domain-containing protein n=1 Tax=Fluviicola taffensis (strain DSM 16823 / NCIMB 13979 / RW262) TaxID=755732 RepID=F2IIX1_FLUTR|nr:hypothetical protein [Fluviicola taffensis]AEA42828.1 hypothetical protein Fluta_0826 [Fluviicola taffensis DSM 16823]